MAEVAILSTVAGVFSLSDDGGEWKSVDNGASRVNLLHDHATSEFRIVALSVDRSYVMNARIHPSLSLEQSHEEFLCWRESDVWAHGLRFPSNTECMKFIQAWRLANSLMRQAEESEKKGRVAAAEAAKLAASRSASTSSVLGADDNAENGVVKRPKWYEEAIDGVSLEGAVSFQKSIVSIEHALLACLCGARDTVAVPNERHHLVIAVAIGKLKETLSNLLAFFVQKVRGRIGDAEPPSPYEHAMRKMHSAVVKMSTEGEPNAYALKAARGLRRQQVLRIYQRTIEESFSHVMLISLQVMAALNSMKLIELNSTELGRGEGVASLQLCAVILFLMKSLRKLSDNTTTYAEIWHHVDEGDDATPESAEAESRAFWDECTFEEKFDKEGKAFSMNELVQRLTSLSDFDQKFNSTFITTYQSFCVPTILFNKLLQRYSGPGDGGAAEQLRMVQQRVIIVFKYWFEHHFNDFTPDLIQNVYDFIDNRLTADGHESMARALRSYVEKKVEERTHATAVLFTVPETLFDVHQLTTPTSTRAPATLIYELSAEQIAEQLTILDSDLYRQVVPTEFLNQAWANKKLKYRAHTLISLAQRSTAISWWVATMVLMQTTEKQRVAMLHKFVNTGRALRRHGNFHTLMAIIAGLNTSPIHRLRRHWAQLSKKRLKVLEDLNVLMNPDGAYKRYREALDSSPLPALPYVGVHLTDLTFIEDGNPDLVDGKVNFKKRSLVYDAISFIQRFQQQPYDFQRIEPAHTYLACPMHLAEDELYKISLAVEPRNVKK